MVVTRASTVTLTFGLLAIWVLWMLLASLSAVLIAAAAGIAVVIGRQAMSTDVVKAVKEDW